MMHKSNGENGAGQFSVKIRREAPIRGYESYNTKSWSLSTTFFISDTMASVTLT